MSVLLSAPMTLPARPFALFISDLHLQVSHPRTLEAFLRFLAERAVHAEHLYLLGDIFEYWAGDDDVADPFHQTIITAIRAVADAGVAVYWIAGNRDFLVGTGFAHAAHLTLLQEPHVIEAGTRRIALVHGDAQCTLDTKYIAFRAQVRAPDWQAQFLGMPLAQRKGIIAGLREGSREAHTGKSYETMCSPRSMPTSSFTGTRTGLPCMRMATSCATCCPTGNSTTYPPAVAGSRCTRMAASCVTPSTAPFSKILPRSIRRA
jgi:UDP-2,3-diacylglucosamine hydrolase